jgi:hypothetical protein
MRIPKLLLAALMFLVFSSAAHADLHQAAHRFKEDVKGAAIGIGHGARDAAHAVGRTSKKVGHAVANSARNGYRATKASIHKHTGETK